MTNRAFYLLAIVLIIPACGDKQPDVMEEGIEAGQETETNAPKTVFAVAAKGTVGELQEFLRESGDINARDEDGLTLLHIAVMGVNPDVVEFLLEKGADVNARNKWDATPLHQVQVRGRRAGPVSKYTRDSIDTAAMKRIADKLLSKGADINAKDDAGSTPLHILALIIGDTELAKFYISKGADVNAVSNSGHTPLDYSTDPEEDEDDEMAAVLRAKDGKHGDPNRLEMFKAATNGDYKRMKELLAKGADVHVCDMYGNTTLFEAAKNGHTKIVKLLIANGADVNEGGSIPVMCMAGNREIAEILLANGARVNAICEANGLTALHYAISNGKKEVALLLLGKGASVNTKDCCNDTPLHSAVKRWYVDVAEQMIMAGAKVNEANTSDRTPLDMADTQEMKDLLLEHGAVSGKELKEK
jgi:ankyrin repeat protein